MLTLSLSPIFRFYFKRYPWRVLLCSRSVDRPVCKSEKRMNGDVVPPGGIPVKNTIATLLSVSNL